MCFSPKFCSNNYLIVSNSKVQQIFRFSSPCQHSNLINVFIYGQSLVCIVIVILASDASIHLGALPKTGLTSQTVVDSAHSSSLQFVLLFYWMSLFSIYM